VSIFLIFYPTFSRVPLTIKAAQEITQSILPEQLDKSAKYKSYSFCNVCSEYAGVKQQWVVVESEERKKKDQFYSAKSKRQAYG
jgi:transposase